MFRLEDLKAIEKYFRGTEKKRSDGSYKLIIEGLFHFDVPENCVSELAGGSIELKIAIFNAFPYKCPVAFIKDPSLWLFPHTRMDDGEICPPNNAMWASNPTLEAFLEYLNELFNLFASNISEKPDDYYELPSFPASPSSDIYMVFEGGDFEWLKSGATAGFFSFSVNGNMVKVEKIGCTPCNDKKSFWGIYIWLSFEPIVKYKRPPITLGELAQVLNRCNFSIDTIISKMRQLNLKKVSVIIGFPIKIKNNDAPSDTHWQLLLFSNEAFISLLRKKRKKSKGKHKDENYASALEEFLSCKSNERVEYRHSYNCSKQFLYSRVGNVMGMKSYAIFGCGAIGSHIAFYFARSGHKNLCLVDSDFIEPGNICRHSLDFSSVEKSKAVELCKKLRDINPWGDFIPYVKNIFSFDSESEDLKKISSCDVWIDAGLPASTSSYLASFATSFKKRIISCYVTDKAKYFVILISGYECDPSNLSIEEKLTAFLKTAKEEKLRDCFQALTKIEASAAVRPSIGCYSLTFQASETQISSVAAIAHSIISDFVDQKDKAGGFKIYAYDEASFTYNLLLDSEGTCALVG